VLLPLLALAFLQVVKEGGTIYLDHPLPTSELALLKLDVERAAEKRTARFKFEWRIPRPNAPSDFKMSYRQPYIVDLGKDYRFGGRRGAQNAMVFQEAKYLFPDPSSLVPLDLGNQPSGGSEIDISVDGDPVWFPFDRYLVVGVIGLDEYVDWPPGGVIGGIGANPVASTRTASKGGWEYQPVELPVLTSEIPYMTASFTTELPEHSSEMKEIRATVGREPSEFWEGPGFVVIVRRSYFVIGSALILVGVGLVYVLRVWRSRNTREWNSLEFVVSILALRGAFMFAGAPLTFTLFDAFTLALLVAYGAAFLQHRRELRDNPAIG
jgi:hypothetical protein